MTHIPSLPVVTLFYSLIAVNRGLEDAVPTPPRTVVKPIVKPSDKVIVLSQINGAATVGIPQVFKVMKGSKVVQSLKLAPEMTRISVSHGTWENFVGGVYNFEIEGDVTNLNIASTFFNYDCVFDLKE